MGIGIYSGQDIRGTEFSAYTLTIETKEQVNTGVSTLMPVPVFDSIRIEDFPFGGPPPGEDFPKMLTVSFHNDPAREDHYMLR